MPFEIVCLPWDQEIRHGDQSFEERGGYVGGQIQSGIPGHFSPLWSVWWRINALVLDVL